MNKITCATLPEGTFSHEAAQNYFRRNVIQADTTQRDSIQGCCDAIINKEVDYAFIPIMNSTTHAAWVNETLHEILTREIQICGEEVLEINLQLIGESGLELSEITKIYSKDKALEQCDTFLTQHCPHALRIAESSTERGVQRAASEKGKAAAIGTQSAANKHQLSILAQEIQNNKQNKTRFVLIRSVSNEALTQPTGSDKTTIAFEFADSSQSGLLSEVLNIFENHKVSLSYIQSLPCNGSLDNFIFYCEFQGHIQDKHVTQTIREIQEIPPLHNLKIIGSYAAYK